MNEIFTAHCNHLLGNKTLLEELINEKFDLAVVDLIYNPCSLSLASHFLRLPVVGYWAFSFVNGEADYTTVSTPPSYIPTFMTGYTDNMDFYQRTINLLGKLFSNLLMFYHSTIMDSTIQYHFKGNFFYKNLNANYLYIYIYFLKLQTFIMSYNGLKSKMSLYSRCPFAKSNVE